MHQPAHVHDATRNPFSEGGRLLHGIGALALAAVLLSAAGCGGGGAYSTPEATFDTFKNATADGDWEKAAACLTPESRDQMAGAMVLMGGMAKMAATFAQLGGAEAAGDAEVQKMKQLGEKAEEIFKKHGVEEDAGGAPTPGAEPDMAKLASGVENKNQFIGEMMEAITAIMPNAKEDMEKYREGKLTDVQIDGDTATCKTNIEEEESITFKKINGEWKMDIGLAKELASE